MDEDKMRVGMHAVDVAFRELDKRAWRCFIDGVLVGAVCVWLIWTWHLA